MTPTTKLSTSLAACLAISPLMAIAADTNFPRHEEPSSVDSIIVGAMDAVAVSKRALVDYGVYDQEADPAKWLTMQIAGRGQKMQRAHLDTLGPMYSMRFIMDRVRGIENQVITTFHEKRAIHCVLTDEDRYEALPGTTYSEEVKFCRERPDWKRYEVGEVPAISRGATGVSTDLSPEVSLTSSSVSEIGDTTH